MNASARAFISDQDKEQMSDGEFATRHLVEGKMGMRDSNRWQ